MYNVIKVNNSLKYSVWTNDKLEHYISASAITKTIRVLYFKSTVCKY